MKASSCISVVGDSVPSYGMLMTWSTEISADAPQKSGYDCAGHAAERHSIHNAGCPLLQEIYRFPYAQNCFALKGTAE